MSKAYFNNTPVEKITVTLDDPSSGPIVLEKRKSLRDLSPCLTKDTVLFFGLRKSEEAREGLHREEEVLPEPERNESKHHEEVEEVARKEDEEQDVIARKDAPDHCDVMKSQKEDNSNQTRQEIEDQDDVKRVSSCNLETLEETGDHSAPLSNGRSLPTEEMCIQMLKATWPILDSFDITVSDISWNMKSNVKDFKFTDIEDLSRTAETPNPKGHSFNADLTRGTILSGLSTQARSAKDLWVAKEIVSQFVTFKVKKMVLNRDVLKRAVTIGSFAEDQIKQEEAAAKFLKEVPMEILCPSFGIGGWFRATTKAYYHSVCSLT